MSLFFAAITSYLKTFGLRTTYMYYFIVLEISGMQDSIPYRDSRREFAVLPFPASGGNLYLLAPGSFIFKACNAASSLPSDLKCPS